MIKWMTLTALTVFLLAGCGGRGNPDLQTEKAVPDNQKISGFKAEIISGTDTLTFDQDTLAGTGSIRFASVLSGTDTANNYLLNFELAEGGSVVLVTNSDQNLTVGVELQFARTGNNLKVVAVAGSDLFDLSQFFVNLNASSRLYFSVDIHNDHGAVAHILVWDENNASVELVNDILNGKGFGPHWGLKLNQAKIFSIGRSDPRDNH